MRYIRAALIASSLAAAYALVVVTVQAPLLVAIVGVLIAVAKARRRRGSLDACGTARWAELDDLKAAGMLGPDSGLIVGRMAMSRPALSRAVASLFDRRVPSNEACEQFTLSVRNRRRRPSALVRLPDAVHTATFCPTGGGKGVSLVVPFLLTCRESVVVIDFKGENFTLTGEHRRAAFRHKVVVLDAFKAVTDKPDTFNVLDGVDSNSLLAPDDIRNIAKAIVVRSGEEKEPHWNDLAELILTAMISLVCLSAEGANRSLQAVRVLVTDQAKMQLAVKLMCESPAWDGMLSRLGHQVAQIKDKELASALTTTNRHLTFLDTLLVAANTRTSSFDPKELLTGRMSIYLVLPPEHARAQAGLLRLWIDAIMRVLVRGGLQERKKTHFVLDEASSLGRLDVLQDALAVYRGYGVRLQFYYQSVAQLKECWPEGQDQTVLANTTQIYMAVNDNQTAEYISNRLGEHTIIVDSGGTNTGGSTSINRQDAGGSTGRSWGGNRGWAQQARKLLKPEEVMALDARVAVVFTPGVPPIATRLVRYYEERLDKNPDGFRLLFRIETWCVAAVLLASTVFVAALLTKAAVQPSHRIPPAWADR